MPVYDPGSATGRMLALDLDPGRGRGAADPTAQVSIQADAIARLLVRLGGRCVTDVAPSGGRHIYVLFAAALPWRELRDLCKGDGAAVPVDRHGADEPARAARSARPAQGISPAAGGCCLRP